MKNDEAFGIDALKYFHNLMVGQKGYKLTFDELTNQVGGKKPYIFFDSFGFTIRSIGLRQSQIEDAMESLAEKTPTGKIPHRSSFFTALSDRKANLTFTDWVYGAPEIAGNTAIDLAKGAQQVGSAVIDAGKTLTMIGPILVVSAIVYIGYQYTKKVGQGFSK